MAALGTRRMNRRQEYTWPGFVDALSTLLLVLIFLLVVFVIGQFILGQALSSKDDALNQLNSELAELADLLALERASNADLKRSLELMSASLNDQSEAGEDMQTRLLELSQRAASAEEELEEMRRRFALTAGNLEESQAALETEKQLSEAAQAQVALLNAQIAELRRQLARVEAALEAEESRAAEQQSIIANLGKRLNAALASKVEELSRYRSDFFGRLREVLGDIDGVEVVGDRFVFQSEVLFTSGSAELGPQGEAQLAKLAATLKQIIGEIPSDIDWVLRIDGHTDTVPIRNLIFANNRELSVARALSVVNLLADQGVPPERLVAAGFGEYHPLSDGQTRADFARNRRIEIKLTQR